MPSTAEVEALKEVNHAITLLGGEDKERLHLKTTPSFDVIADAAEALTRSANRLAPNGHKVTFIRESR